MLGRNLGHYPLNSRQTAFRPTFRQSNTTSVTNRRRLIDQGVSCLIRSGTALLAGRSCGVYTNSDLRKSDPRRDLYVIRRESETDDPHLCAGLRPGTLLSRVSNARDYACDGERCCRSWGIREVLTRPSQQPKLKHWLDSD